MAKRGSEADKSSPKGDVNTKRQKLRRKSRLFKVSRDRKRSRAAVQLESVNRVSRAAALCKNPQVGSIAETLDVAALMRKVSKEEIQAMDKVRLAQAEKFSSAIFKLCETDKIKDFSAYKALVGALEEQFSSEMVQAILDTACSLYRATYGPMLRARGYSQDLIDHIIHRLGKDSREAITTLIKGFDVRGEAKKLWEITSKAAGADVIEQVSAILFELANKQVREVRQEYARIPAKLIASKLHELFETNEAEPEEVMYALRGREATEIAQIEFEYNEQFNKEGIEQASFRARLAAALGGEDTPAFKDIIDGFDAQREAQALLKIIDSPAVDTEYVEHSRVYAEACMDRVTLAQDFHISLRISATEETFSQREIDHRVAIEDRICCLTHEQLLQVNRQIKEVNGQELQLELYANGRPFDVRHTALWCKRALEEFRVTPDRRHAKEVLSAVQHEEIRKKFWEMSDSGKDLNELVEEKAEQIRVAARLRAVRRLMRPIESLSPVQHRMVREQFLAMTGKDIEGEMMVLVSKICEGEPKATILAALNRRFSGGMRLELTPDILVSFSSKELHRVTREREVRERARTLVAELKPLIHKCHKEKPHVAAQEVLAALSREDYITRCAFEREYLALSDGKEVLLEELEERFTCADFIEAKLLLAGFDAREAVDSIEVNPAAIIKLKGMGAEAIACVTRLYISKYKRQLISRYQEEEFLSAAPILATPEALSLERMLTSETKLDPGVIRILHQLFAGDDTDIQALETAFDYNFGRLRMRLKVLASKGKLERQDFSELTLRLEGVRPTLVQELRKALADKDIESLHYILREFRQHLLFIQAVYNICNPAQHLRSAINSLEIDRLVKNRTILLLDGFDPEHVVEEIRDALNTSHGEMLGQRVFEILNDRGDVGGQYRIPADPNWTDEMYHQIRTLYKLEFKERLLVDLRLRDVPLKGKGLNAIAFMLYGDQAKLAVDLRSVLSGLQSNGSHDYGHSLPARVIQILEDRCHRSAAVRERVIDMYEAYFYPPQAGRKLRSELAGAVTSEFERQRIISLIDEAFKS